MFSQQYCDIMHITFLFHNNIFKIQNGFFQKATFIS
uniref:Uncharacterized protein n=1 Tax=Anguilla anguilla TaxID=7936 RepID=A0A0E9TA80_ANGAN